MILDNLENVKRYEKISDKFKMAFDFLNSIDLNAMEPGKHAISGDDVFVLIQEYTTHKAEGRYMEAHRKFADIQVVIQGKETIYYANSPKKMELHQAYDESKDCVLYSPSDFSAACRLAEGDFAVFYPNELHQPCCEMDGCSEVKKAVVKVSMD